MPAALDRCVEEVLARPDFAPQEGRTPEESAFAICRTSIGLASDGSEDEKEIEMADEEIERRATNEMTRGGFTSRPILRKKMPIAEAIGEFTNGPQEGVLDLALLRTLVENYKKQRRQVPVYLVTGSGSTDHPSDLDERLADGWIEGLEIEGQKLIGDVKLHGDAALAVANDQVRGASIGVIFGKSYTGEDIGRVLEHVVLTNSPFIKGMNIAASQREGREKVAWYFTTLKKEAAMAEKDPKKPDESMNLQEKITALECLLQEKEKQIRELTASCDNMKEELEKRRENTDLTLAQKRIDKMDRQLRAERIRRKVKKGIDAGQFNIALVKGYDDDSDEIVLAWFKNSSFEGSEDRLDFALKTFPKIALNRRFASGQSGEDTGSVYTAEDREFIKKSGKDPDLLEKTRTARNFTEYKRLKAEAKGA